jgi:hypothetical protein
VRAYAADTLDEAFKSLTGAARDKGLDAVHIDRKHRQVLIVQGKARRALMKADESRAAVKDFASITRLLAAAEDSQELAQYLDGLNPKATTHFREARKCLQDRFHLRMAYVTTGRVSEEVDRVARLAIAKEFDASVLEIVDGRRLMVLVRDYQDGVAPPVPSLELPVEDSGIIEQQQAGDGVTTWVFSMRGDDVASLYNRAGKRIFARNIRGYLGDTKINASMVDTIRSEPEAFFYCNNGVTVVCDDLVSTGGKRDQRLLVSNPQIINGQQTTRSLYLGGAEAANVRVLVRVIQLNRDETSSTQSDYESTVSRIVKATNWQNPITPADLRSNDAFQVDLERALRAYGYQYLRKREDKVEAAERLGSHLPFTITKEDLALAVGACEYDQFVGKIGQQRRFGDQWYERLFSKTDPVYYLTCYWLVERARRLGRGDPVRTHAKWLAAHIIWQRVGKQLAADYRFVRACEAQKGRAFSATNQLMERTLKQLVSHYKRNKKVEGYELEPSTFFKSHAPKATVEKARTAAAKRSFDSAVRSLEEALKAATLN